MKLQDINVNEVLRIEQEPIIVYQELEKIGEEVDSFLDTFNLDELEITEDNRTMVRTTRTEIRKVMKEFEDRRLNVRRAILDPYDQFNKLYQEHIGKKFKTADKQLKGLLDEIEIELLDEKRKGFMSQFEDLKEKYGFEFVEFDQVDTKITLSSTLKSTEEDIQRFFDKVQQDIVVIETQPEEDNRRTRILAEYKNTLDLASSITNVNNSIDRELAIKKEQERKEIERELKNKQVIQEPEDRPTEDKLVVDAPEEEVEFITKFEVKGTKKEIIELVNFLKSHDYQYKNIE